jgi:DNA-binding NarL/FixJ family response regulator
VIRVLIADDQRVVREGRAMVLGLLPGVEVVGAACDGREAVDLAVSLRPDVVLMDLRMPRCDGAEATRLLREREPGVRVVVLTTYADDRSVIEALQAGARGYLTKNAGGPQIREALERVVADHAVIDPAVQHHLVDAIAAAPPGRADAEGGRGADADRGRLVERGDRRPAGGYRGHGEESRQPPARQDRRAGRGPGGHLRLPARPRRPPRSVGFAHAS